MFVLQNRNWLKWKLFDQAKKLSENKTWILQHKDEPKVLYRPSNDDAGGDDDVDDKGEVDVFQYHGPILC